MEWRNFTSLSEFHSILTPVEWKFTTQRVESRPVHSILTPKEVFTEVTPQGVTSVTKWVKIHSIFKRVSLDVLFLPSSVAFDTHLDRTVGEGVEVDLGHVVEVLGDVRLTRRAGERVDDLGAEHDHLELNDLLNTCKNTRLDGDRNEGTIYVLQKLWFYIEICFGIRKKKK